MKKTKDIKLSIIIPRYSEDFTLLKETLYSIQNQIGYDLSKVEVVIVDDSAGQFPMEIPTDEFTFQIQIVKMDENSGTGWSRECGVRASNSNEFIYFLDADDLLEHDALYTFNQVLEQRGQQLDIVQFGGKLVGYDTNAQRYVIQPHFASTVWCHPPTYRVLTPEGWKRFDECEAYENIYTCNAEGQNGGFEKCPLIIAPNESKLIKVSAGKDFDIIASPNHKLPVNNATEIKRFDELRKGDKIVREATNIQSDTEFLELYKFKIIYQADGYRLNKSKISFHFKRQDKINEVERLCRILELDFKTHYSEKDGTTYISIDLSDKSCVNNLIDKDLINVPLEDLSQQNARILLNYLILTDGNIR